MANLFSNTVTLDGYKTLAELTGLTFTANTVYMVQVICSNQEFFVREGATGNGFKCNSKTPFQWTYDGVNDLYIGYASGGNVYINVAG